MYIILIGNYLPDDQVSMQRFTLMLNAGYNNAGIKNEIWFPKVFFGKFVKSTYSGFGKWLGYIDKWIIYPLILKRRIKKGKSRGISYSFQICDHSNAPYLKYLPTEKTVVTCHDVLAIMGALGYPDTYCESSHLGKFLQSWILKYLSASKKLAAVSQHTLLQLNILDKQKIAGAREWRVIHNGFNEDFKRVTSPSRSTLLNSMGQNQDAPFLLHVGSGQPRKNRKLLVEMISILKDKWNGKICFAGEGLDQQLLNYASSLGVRDKVISVVHPDHKMLIALYSACDAFVFPSYSEGFGWPLIEAQACGAPVISSNIEPMPEVTGGAALHKDPYKAKEFAEAFISLQNTSIRDELIKKGFENCVRFNNTEMIQQYITLHRLNLN